MTTHWNLKKYPFLFFLAFFNFALTAQSWTAAQWQKANTAKNVDYLPRIEKETILYINLARMFPKDFIKWELSFYVGKNQKDYPFETSLINHLSNMTAASPIYADKLLYESAKCFAVEQGENGETGHERKNCSKGNYAECISYGMNSGKSIVLQLLIDDGVPSLGHRKICLDWFYAKVGISTQKHKTYGSCTVLDFIW